MAGHNLLGGDFIWVMLTGILSDPAYRRGRRSQKVLLLTQIWYRKQQAAEFAVRLILEPTWQAHPFIPASGRCTVKFLEYLVHDTMSHTGFFEVLSQQYLKTSHFNCSILFVHLFLV